MLADINDYKNAIYSLSFNKMAEIYADMRKDIIGDADAEDIYREDVLPKMIKYTNTRALWATYSRETKMDEDKWRTLCHDSLIRNINMLANYLVETGKEAAWRDELGDTEKDPTYRKTIGDFACFVAFVEGLGER